MGRVIFTCWFLLSSGTALATDLGQIKEFKTDFCSSFPNGTLTTPKLWAHCCMAHDIYYWAGLGGRKMRMRSDENLKVCVNEAIQESEETLPDHLGNIMKRGVFFGGSGLWWTPWRWGYGWKFQGPLNLYFTLNNEQLKQVLGQAHKLVIEYLLGGTIAGRNLPLPEQNRYVLGHLIKYIKFIKAELRKNQ